MVGLVRTEGKRVLRRKVDVNLGFRRFPSTPYPVFFCFLRF